MYTVASAPAVGGSTQYLPLTPASFGFRKFALLFLSPLRYSEIFFRVLRNSEWWMVNPVWLPAISAKKRSRGHLGKTTMSGTIALNLRNKLHYSLKLRQKSRITQHVLYVKKIISICVKQMSLWKKVALGQWSEREGTIVAQNVEFLHKMSSFCKHFKMQNCQVVAILLKMLRCSKKQVFCKPKPPVL